MKKLTDRQKLLIIIAAGILARVLYIMLMPVVEFAQYDKGSVYLDENVMTGHLGYIFYLVQNHGVPDFDPRTIYQFNHPPVHHILCALMVSFVKLFTDDFQIWVESIQVVTLLYSVITLFVSDKICEELNLKFSARTLVITILAFQPTLIMTAGSVNNDGAGLMFMVLATWFALRFYRTRSYKDILLLALSIGVGMLSKLSAGLIAVPVGVLMLYVLIKEWVAEKKFPGKRFLQYVVFAVVCCPIGLFWVLRCYLKFGMPPTYIAFLPETSEQYIGMYSFAERMLLPNPIELCKNLLHGKIGMGWNIWVQMARTSALGECDLAEISMAGKAVAMGMLGINFLIALWAFVDFVRVAWIARKTKAFALKDRGLRIFFVLGWITMMYSYLSFGNTYPHECSLNFRYIQYAIWPPLLALGYMEGSKDKVNAWKKALVGVYMVLSLAIVVIWHFVAM